MPESPDHLPSAARSRLSSKPSGHGQARRYDWAYSAPPDESAGLVLDVEPVTSEMVRPSKRGHGETRPWSEARNGRLSEGDAIQRVGGRRRIRPEVVLLVAGAIFLVGVLLKPWPNPTARPRSPIAAASSAPAHIQPPVLPGETTPPDAAVGVPGELAQLWSTVDWSILSSTDPHSDWGFAAVNLPSQADNSTGSDAMSPATAWVATDSPPQKVMVPVGHGRSVFALAVTWPADINVSSVTFVYLGGPEHPPYLPPAGFPPFTQVSPLPAERVASPQASAAATPTGPPAARSTLAARRTVRSGEFWIPPSEASSSPPSTSVRAAWRSFPWPWPNGTYRVTVTSLSGTTTISLHLQQVG
jgi:hypothetical protein